MIYKIFAGTVAVLAVLIVVGLRVNTTGSYERTSTLPPIRYGGSGMILTSSSSGGAPRITSRRASGTTHE
jgi:hypothetical protein